MLNVIHVDGGRVVSVSVSETSVSSSTPTNAIIYDAYTSIIKKLAEKNSDEDVQKLKKRSFRENKL